MSPKPSVMQSHQNDPRALTGDSSTPNHPTSVSNAYWDLESSGQTESAAGIGLTTAELKAQLPTGFDPSVWGLDAAINEGYPYLLWETAGPPTAVIFAPPFTGTLPLTPDRLIDAFNAPVTPMEVVSYVENVDNFLAENVNDTTLNESSSVQFGIVVDEDNLFSNTSFETAVTTPSYVDNNYLSPEEIALLRSLPGSEFEKYYGSALLTRADWEPVEAFSFESAALVLDFVLTDGLPTYIGYLDIAYDYGKLAKFGAEAGDDLSHEWAAFRAGYEIGDPEKAQAVRWFGELIQYLYFSVEKAGKISVNESTALMNQLMDKIDPNGILDRVEMQELVYKYDPQTIQYMMDMLYDVTVMVNGALYREEGGVIEL